MISLYIVNNFFYIHDLCLRSLLPKNVLKNVVEFLGYNQPHQQDLGKCMNRRHTTQSRQINNNNLHNLYIYIYIYKSYMHKILEDLRE